MSHVVCLSDAAFETPQRPARARGEAPETIVEHPLAAAEVAPFGPAYSSGQHYYELNDWLRHLGVSGQELAEVGKNSPKRILNWTQRSRAEWT